MIVVGSLLAPDSKSLPGVREGRVFEILITGNRSHTAESYDRFYGSRSKSFFRGLKVIITDRFWLLSIMSKFYTIPYHARQRHKANSARASENALEEYNTAHFFLPFPSFVPLDIDCACPKSLMWLKSLVFEGNPAWQVIHVNYNLSQYFDRFQRITHIYWHRYQILHFLLSVE